MSEPDTKIRDLMEELAREARLAPGLERPTLRRAVRRRVVGPTVAVLLVVGVGVGGFAAVRELGERSLPATRVTPSAGAPTPSTGPTGPIASPAPTPSTGPTGTGTPGPSSA